MHALTNIAALLATLALGVAAWWLTRGATPYPALDLVGAALVWALLAALTVAFTATIAKALREG